MNLTQKERLLLEDQKKHEELCIQKYIGFANQVQDPQLKQLFLTHAQQERQHLDTINKILAGQVPNPQAQGQGQQQPQGQQPGQQQFPGQQPGQNPLMPNNNQGPMAIPNANDASLCNDLLMTEKYVSGTYDTAIFEFRDTNVRQVLNHIQKEEQQHGEDLFNYLNSHGMYSPLV